MKLGPKLVESNESVIYKHSEFPNRVIKHNRFPISVMSKDIYFIMSDSGLSPKVYSVSADRYFVEMEYMCGTCNLQISPHTTNHILRKVNNLLTSTHQLGIAHRDIKSNNFIQFGDEVKIIDFNRSVRDVKLSCKEFLQSVAFDLWSSYYKLKAHLSNTPQLEYGRQIGTCGDRFDYDSNHTISIAKEYLLAIGYEFKK